jgi:hypothetical protein
MRGTRYVCCLTCAGSLRHGRQTVSIRAIQAVWDRSTVGGSLRLLLLALADFADEDGYSWPSVETLSKRAGRTERHVRRLITLAIAAGELKADRVGGTTSSRYWLTPGGVPVGGDVDVLPPGRGRPPRGDIGVRGGGTPVSSEPSSNGQGTSKEPSGDIRPRKTYDPENGASLWNGRGLHDGRHGAKCAVCLPLVDPIPSSKKGRAA